MFWSNPQLRRAIARIPGARWIYRSFVQTPGSWIFSEHSAKWLLDAQNFSRLPFLYRAFATYCSLAPKSDEMVVGAETVHRMVSWLTRVLALDSQFCVSVERRKVYVSLTDPRSLVVPYELSSAAEIHALRKYLAPGDLFIDVGANHGVFSIAASSLVGSTGRVVAFEPNPELAELVRLSLSTDQVAEFQVHQIALADADGELDFYIPHATSGSAGLIRGFSAESSARRIRVTVRTLDQVLKPEPGRRTVMKVDIEGAELRFFAGARDYLLSQRPLVLVEVNPSAIAAAEGTISDFVSLLKSCGYSRWRDFHHGIESSIDNLPPIQQNVLLLPSTSIH